MNDVDTARQTLQQIEQDASGQADLVKCKGVYREAAAMFHLNGSECEAKGAQWMAWLMALATVLPQHRRKTGDGWFGPHVTPDAVTEEMLEFYKSRRDALENPIIKSRCCDIIWEERKDHSAARQAIEEHLKAAHVSKAQSQWSLVVRS